MYSAILETQRLLLKGLSPAGISHVFENFTKHEIKALLGHQTEEAFLQEEDKYKKGYDSYNRTFLLFLLVEKEASKIIGRCGIHNWNMAHSRAEIGYNITDESFKNKGYMTEAVEAIIRHGFCTLKLNRLEAIVGCANIPSLRLMEKFGFCREGVLRQHYPLNGTFEDSIMFSRLQQEYQSGGEDHSNKQGPFN